MNRPCVTPHQPPSGFERSRRTDSATKLGNPTFIYPTNESLRAGVSPQKKGGSATSDRDTTDACEPGLHGPCAMHGPSAVRRAESAHTAVSKRRHRRMATTARVMVTHGRRCPLNHPHRRSTPLGPRWSGHDSRPRRDPRGASEPHSGGDGSDHRNAVRLALRRARRPRGVHR